jgi:FkbM family methyltransferase
MEKRMQEAMDWVYSGRRKAVIDRAGLADTVRPLYNRIQHRAHPDKVAITIAGERVKFHSSRWSEVRRFREIGEREIIADLLGHLSPDDQFFDIGANVGLFSVFAATKADGVFAFEPIQTTLARLNQNMLLNGTKAALLPFALSDTDDVETLELTEHYLSTVGTAGHVLSSASTGSQAQEDASRQLPILSRRGDSLVSEGIVPHPTALKIDVDGAEHLVLDGLTNSLQRDECSLIYVENHRNLLKNQGIDWRDIEHKLEDCGFETSRMSLADRSDDSGTYILRGMKPTR